PDPSAITRSGRTGAVWTIQVQGKDKTGVPFISSMFNYSGGTGARASKPGLSATSYPTGVSAVSTEALEASIPIEFTCKELVRGSGGRGQQNGGDGQKIGFRMRSGHEWLLNAIPSRLRSGPEGLNGGGPGDKGSFLINGVSADEAKKITMQPSDEVVMITPGGGGIGAPD
ncbi:MAG: hydantoinase B/oxoprolinase family protein, partial [Pseudomonadota bacterium]